MPHPPDSARERLKRADENIRNLNSEIAEFVKGVPVVPFNGMKPVWTDQEREAFEMIKNHLINTTVPARFSVLAGEVIHHLRSSFDHLAWQLSDTNFRNGPDFRDIEFPIYKRRPEVCRLSKKKICSYCRKVQGITSPGALVRIYSLQPYLRIEPSHDPLWIINEMDRIDKHRELVLVVGSLMVHLSGFAHITGVGEQRPWEIMPIRFRPTERPKVNVQGNISAQVAFRKFGKREDEPVVKGLQDLSRFAKNTIESFTNEF